MEVSKEDFDDKVREMNERHMRRMVKVFDDVEKRPRSERSKYWEKMMELSDSIPDDDPRLEPGYRQYALDGHTKDMIRAKYMKTNINGMANCMASIMAALGGLGDSKDK